MAIRDLIPWSRQENRVPVPVSAERDRETHPLQSLHRDVNRLFDDIFRNFGMPAFAGFDRLSGWPHLELGETDKEIRVTAELPGMDDTDIEIFVEDGALTLRGEKKAEVDDKDRGCSERSYGRFERRIGLPRGIERDKVAATFNKGVVTVTLPRTEAAEQHVRRIPVNGGAR